MLLYYPDGRHVRIPDIDSAIWIQLHGLSSTPPERSEVIPAREAKSDGITALEAINQAQVVDDVAVLPSIGKGSAKVILDARPEGGYKSLEQVWELCPALLSRPYNVNPEVVATYGHTP